MIKKALAIFITGLLISCGSPQKKAFDLLKNDEKQFYSKYKTIELTKEAAKPILSKYKQFLKNYPKFENNPEIMLRYADVYMGTKQYFLALEVYDQFDKKYPNHKKRAFVLFNKGYSCELAYRDSKFNKHRDFAFAFYKQFLEKYPKHALAKAIHLSIDELTKIEPKITK